MNKYGCFEVMAAGEKVRADSLGRHDRVYMGGGGPNALYKVLGVEPHPEGLAVHLRHQDSQQNHVIPVPHDFPFDLAWRGGPMDFQDEEYGEG